MNRQAERTRELMLDAAAELLHREGPDAVTHLRVADAAGVARTTVYRHWHNRTDLVLDALLSGASPSGASPQQDDLSLVDSVTAILERLATALNSENGRIIATLIGRAEWEDDMLAAKRRMAGVGIGRLTEILSAAAEAGDLSPDSSVEMLAERLAGPLYARRLIRHEPIPEGYASEVVSIVLSPFVRP